MNLNDATHLTDLAFRSADAVVVIDLQQDFLPGGALAARDGDQIIPDVNQLLTRARQQRLPVVFTQDWHPADHYSFASMHEGKQPFDPYEAPGLGPVLWPDHCVQGSKGGAFADDLDDLAADTIIRKGYNREIDSYSGFLENDHRTETGLDGYLKGRGVRRILVCGLAYDYCVYFTAADGADKGYEVVVLSDLTEPVGAPEGSVGRATADLQNKGVQFATSGALVSS